MTSRRAFWKWAVLGAIAATILAFGQSRAVGGPAGMLQVGETSALRAVIESELDRLPLASGPGHDGQIYYAIGLDLLGEEVPPLLNHGAYRYRRILYSAVASGFGSMEGEALLWGMILTAILSTAAAAGFVAALATRQGRSDWLALAVLLNPGVWLSVRLLTADVLALALMSAGLYLLVAGPRLAVLPFIFSGLAKDVYLATPAGLALSRDRRRWLLAVIPASVLVGWMVWLTITMGDGFASRSNITIPFLGIVEGAATWPSLGTEEWFYVAFALISVGVGLLYGLFKSSWLRWSLLGWSLLGVISSDWVWDLGNNAARAFAPIVVLVVLAAGQVPAGSTEDSAAREVLLS